MSIDLHGVIPPVITPLTAERQLDRDGLVGHIEHLLSAGVDGIFVLGSSGEASFFSNAEREQIVAATVEATAGRVPVLAGAIDTSPSRVVEQAEFIKAAGADAIVATAPFYAPTSTQDITESFRHIARHSGLPVVAYDIPSNVHLRPTPEVLVALGAEGIITAVKDSSGDDAGLRRLVRLNREAGSPLTIFTGTEVVVDAAYLLGVDGVVPGLSNVAPEAYVQLARAAVDGQWERAVQLQEILEALFEIVRVPSNLVGPAAAIGAFKAAIFHQGIIPTYTTAAPQTLLTEEQAEQVGQLTDAALVKLHKLTH